MVSPLIVVRGPHDGGGDQVRWPIVDEELKLRFEDGETVRWRGSGRVAEARRLEPNDPESEFRAWGLEEVTDLVVTDRRLAYAGQGLEVDRRGPSAHLMEETRRAYGALPDGGRVLVGQVRFQWPISIFVQPIRRPWPAAHLVVRGVEDDCEADLVLLFLKQLMGGPSPREAAENFARALVKDIAKFRLINSSSTLTHSEAERLIALRDRPTSSSTQMTWFDLPGWLPVGSDIERRRDRRPAIKSRLSQATMDALRLAAEEAGERELVDTLAALLGICRLELERWTPAFVRMELSVDGLRARASHSRETIEGATVALGEDADRFELQVTSELEGAIRLAERIVLHYGFETVAPSHLALAIALAPGSGSAVLGSGVASHAEVVTVLSETLFDTSFDGIERLLAETVTGSVRDQAEPAAAPMSAQQAAWAASPYAAQAAPNKPKGARLGFVERIGAIVVLLVIVLILVTVEGLHSSSAAATSLASGRAALAKGDQRAAVRAWREVLRTAPRSLSALVLTSCVEWSMRYSDEAVSYYQQALAAGLSFDKVVVNRPCFVNAPTMHGLQMAKIAGLPVLFAVPARMDRTGVALAAIATAQPANANPLIGEALDRRAGNDLRRPVAAQSILAAACLNDRSNLRMVAAMDLTLALNDPRMPQVNGILRTCAKKFRGRYVVERRSNGQELFLPKDLDDRAFDPDSSPIPGRLPQALP